MQNVYKSLLKCGIHFVYISCMPLLGSPRAQWVTGAKLVGLCPVQCCPKSIKTTLDRMFSYTKLSEPPGLHCIGFSAVQCCLKSSKTTFHWIFSYTKLSEASQTTLHRVFTYAILS